MPRVVHVHLYEDSAEGSKRAWITRKGGTAVQREKKGRPSPQRLLRQTLELGAGSAPKKTLLPKGRALLYHGTHVAFLEMIQEHGVQPMPTLRNYGPDMYRGDRGKSVYLTPEPEMAGHWATNAFGDNGDTIVLEVNVAESRLKEDFNAEYGDFRVVGGIPPEDLKGYYRFKNGELGPFQSFGKKARSSKDAPSRSMFVEVAVKNA